MSILEVTELSQGYAEKTLYQKASFLLQKGEHVGIVGQNGTGKSTLIKILTGEVVPDEGNVSWRKGVRLGHLDQHAEIGGEITVEAYLHTAFRELYELEQSMNALYSESAQSGDMAVLERASAYQEQLQESGFYAADSEVGRVAGGLGLTAVGLDRPVGELSGGQRAKAILAKLLLSRPDVLLLDEPTNFLDKEHVDWLSGYLSAFPGAFVVVSHDYDFLERITTAICDIEFGTIKKYHGKYSEFLKQKTHLREEYVRQYHAQQKEIEKTEEYIRRNKAGVNSKMARGRQKQLDRLERIAPPSFTEKPFIRFAEVPLVVQNALAVKNLEVGYSYPLLPPLQFHVEAGRKLVITGFNGIGKSTLLKTLVNAIPARSGSFRFAEQVKFGYYEQDLKWESPERTPLQIIMDAYPQMHTKEARRALAQCGVKAEHALRAISTLSGGEQSKVKLCRLLLTPCNFLIMDEPTNHLDAESKDALRKALIDFSGSVILVSHEEKFYYDWADKVLDIEKCFD